MVMFRSLFVVFYEKIALILLFRLIKKYLTMKKKVLFLYSILFMLGFAACNSDKDEVIPNLVDVSALEGSYVGEFNCGDKIASEFEITVKRAPRDNKFVFRFSDMKLIDSALQNTSLLIADFTKKTESVYTFEVVDGTLANLKEISLVGKIEDSKLSFVGTGVNSQGVIVDISYTSDSLIGYPEELADFQGDYISIWYSNVGERLFLQKDLQMDVTLDVDAESNLKFVIDGIKSGLNSFNYTFVANAELKAGKCIIKEQNVDIEGFSDATVSGFINEKREIKLLLKGRNTAGDNLFFEFKAYDEAIEAIDVDVLALSSVAKSNVNVAYITTNGKTEKQDDLTVAIAETRNNGEVQFNIQGILINEVSRDFQFVTPVMLENGNRVIANQEVELNGLTNATLTAQFNELGDLSFVLIGEGLDDENVKIEFGELKDEIKRDVLLADWNFEELVSGGNGYLLPKSKNSITWASGDQGIETLSPHTYTISKTSELEDHAILLQTYRTKDLSSAWTVRFAPGMVAGSLFTGKFEMGSIFGDPLTFTKFGNLVTAKVTKVTGKLKYEPGTVFYENKEEVEYREDNYAITAVLYSTEGDFSLDGTNLNDRTKSIGYVQKVGGKVTNFEDFEIELEYNEEFDPNKTYKFALVCSSSKDGDKYWGAKGSKLWLDDINIFVEEVIYE